jgi:hypothetical protein
MCFNVSTHTICGNYESYRILMQAMAQFHWLVSMGKRKQHLFPGSDSRFYCTICCIQFWDGWTIQVSKCCKVHLLLCSACALKLKLALSELDYLGQLWKQAQTDSQKKAHWLSHPSQIISNFVSSSHMKATYFWNHQPARKQSWPRELATLKWMTSQSISQTDHMAIQNKWFRINKLCHVSMIVSAW